MPEQQSRAPVSVFYSYAHADEALRKQLETHLSLLRRQGLLSEWHDREILPGAEWAHEIDEHLQTASIILLLISADFLASDYCYDKEMTRALERHKLGEARVIPIILRPCDWKTSPFAQLQCLPRDGKAVTTWQNTDEAFLAIAEGLRRVIERQQIPVRPLPEVERKNRRALIKRVRTTWIEGLLEHSLHEAVRLELHLQERPDVLTNPWRLQVQELDRPPEPLPAGTSIVEVYDKAEGELLILGEPGAGKTTLLLKLARTLLDRAEADEHHRLPVVFNLSSWAEKRRPLSEWLVEELWTKYQISSKIAQNWMASDQLLPLLDGLDEVAEEARSGCVQIINAYYQQSAEQGPTLLVVCCRSQEYLALPTRVNLHQAVSIQPLTDDQIERYLQSAGGQLEALRHALRNDPELYKLTHRPLMLSIFTLAYQGAVAEDLPTKGTHESQQRQAFASYVERMLSRRGKAPTYSPEQTKEWLARLACQMRRQNQAIFYLEHLQPDWLSSPQLLQVYRRWAILLPGILIGVLASLTIFYWLIGTINLTDVITITLLGGLLGGILSGKSAIQQSEPHSRERKRLSWQQFARWPIIGGLIGLTIGLSQRSIPQTGPTDELRYGIIYGSASLLLQVLLVKSSPTQSAPQAAPTKRPHPTKSTALYNGLLTGVLIGIGITLISGLPDGLRYGTHMGLAGGLISLLLINRNMAVHLTEKVTWSWKSLRRSLWSSQNRRAALQVAALTGLSTGLSIGLSIVGSRLGPSLGLYYGLGTGLSLGPSCGLSYWLVSGLIQGISSETIEEQRRVTPNQGIHHSARNGLVLGLISALIVGLSATLSHELFTTLLTTLFPGQLPPPNTELIVGTSAGLLFGFIMGGWACIQHYILRFLLWRTGEIPWHYSDFLDHTARQILLRKIDGGYIFIHRLLLEHFAPLDTTMPPNTRKEKREEGTSHLTT